uniref:RING-type domain-containing protein n=1 Tax=Pyrodinium bahamense TaxID=73915 RepID=A0A7R9ZYW0_9DINO|mmetsp:Transcript_14999/g.41510  ORF Transcript_14999/g.41510 Transcript_14999/m.41510 type:complete len:282 (+) Transcript_14999:128-973(+)
MTPRPSSSRLPSVQVPPEPVVQAETRSCDPDCEGCYCKCAPAFTMPRPSVGDDTVSTGSPGADAEPPVAKPSWHLAHLPAWAVRQAGGDYVAGSGHRCGDAGGTQLAAVPEVSDELTGVGGIAAEKYYLHVCLGDRIPLETGAARVNISRLETGPEWRDFLQLGVEGELCDGLSLDAVLQCPCCLGTLRRPVALPCGHSLCRGCLMRLPVSSLAVGGARRCPLCRADIPREVHLHVNEHLDAVSEALHVFGTMNKRMKSCRATSREQPARSGASVAAMWSC